MLEKRKYCSLSLCVAVPYVLTILMEYQHVCSTPHLLKNRRPETSQKEWFNDTFITIWGEFNLLMAVDLKLLEEKHFSRIPVSYMNNFTRSFTFLQYQLIYQLMLISNTNCPNKSYSPHQYGQESKISLKSLKLIMTCFPIKPLVLKFVSCWF